MSKISRRDFIRSSLVMTAAVSCGSWMLNPAEVFSKEKKGTPSQGKKEVPLPAGQTAVSESDPVANAIGFKHDIKDIDYAKFPQRKKPEAKNQFCKSCSLYTSVNEGWGKCQMLTTGLVAADGWCGSWNKKA